MTKRNYPILFCLLLCLSFTNCSEDACKDIICENGGTCIEGTCNCPDGFEGEFCEEKIHQLKTIWLNGKVEATFEYNEKGDIQKKEVYLSDGTVYTTDTYHYYTDSLLIKSINHINQIESYQKFEDIGNDEIRSEFFPDGVSFGLYNIFKNVNQACGYDRIEIYKTDGSLITEVTLDFVDEKCSHLRKSRNISLNLVILSIEVTYDAFNHHSPNMNKFLPELNRGNITSFIVKNDVGVMDYFSSYSSVYTYDEYMYPRNEDREYYDGTIRNYYYEYY